MSKIGTGKSGRYLNTFGNRNSVSDFALIHSSEGLYTKPKKGEEIRLKSGGHSQEGMERN